MLDVIRGQAQSWGVKIAFGIIIIVFVFWGVGSMQEGPSAVVVSVNEEPILIRDFGMEYERQAESLRRRFPDMSMEQFEALGFKQQVLQQMITRALVAQEAKSLGITVTPVELRQVITQIPAFHNAEGRFDAEVYKSVLQKQNITLGGFEANMQADLLDTKMRELVTAGAVLTDTEARSLFDFAQERRNAEYALFPVSAYLAEITPTEEQLAAWYEKHKATFTVPQQVVIDYVRITPDSIANPASIAEDAIAAFYADNAAEQFMLPEQMRARHILIRVAEDAPEAEVAKAKERVDAIVAELAAGKDFAEIASSQSDDAGTALNGGELGWFMRGMMVKPFEDAAFALNVGEVSAPVRSQFGYHLIKSEEHQPARQRTLEEVRSEIAQRLAEERAAEELHVVLDSAVEQIASGKSLNDIAGELTLPVETSPALSREALADSLTLSADGVATVFDTPEGMLIDTPLEVTDGYIIAQVQQVSAEHIPALDAVREQVITAVKQKEAKKLAENAAKEALQAAEKGTLPTDMQVTGLFGRDGVIAGLGMEQALVSALFSAPKDTWLAEPQHVAGGVLIARVIGVTAPTDAEWTAAADTVRESILNAKREEMYRAFLESLRAKAVITIEEPAILE